MVNNSQEFNDVVGRLVDFDAYVASRVAKNDAEADAWKKTVEAERDANKPQSYPETQKEAPKEQPKEEEAKPGGILQKMVDSTTGKFAQVGTEVTTAVFAGVMHVESIIKQFSVHHHEQGKEIHQVEQKGQHQGQEQHAHQDQHATQKQQPGSEKKEGQEPELPE
ncbi:MAG TPA: hypothetical protein VGM84_21965 [Steroidobacteraceae bacterium]|jgi:hypothetical protein